MQDVFSIDQNDRPLFDGIVFEQVGADVVVEPGADLIEQGSDGSGRLKGDLERRTIQFEPEQGVEPNRNRHSRGPVRPVFPPWEFPRGSSHAVHNIREAFRLAGERVPCWGLL